MTRDHKTARKLTREEIIERLEAPNGALELANDAGLDRDALFAASAELFAGEGLASALLIRLIKSDKALAARAAGDEGFMAAVRASVSAESPKLRRNACRLIGMLSDSENDASLLIDRLDKEGTRFVRPSLLLALGAIGGEAAEKALSDYSPAEPKDASEEKHYREETDALKQARAACVKHVKHPFTGLGERTDIELRAPQNLSYRLAAELRDLGLEPRNVTPSSLRVFTDDLTGLFACRCFTEALFPVPAKGVAAEPAAIAARFREFVPDFMARTHGGEPPCRYRIETEGEPPTERTAFKKALRDALDCAELLNAPSDYEIELRCSFDGGLRLYLKLFTLEDPRFAYRRESIPASMNPATAAAVLRFAEDFLTVNARVIDPCCGSGTLLIERGLLSPCDSLTGVDISHRAIDAARTNAEAAAEQLGVKQARFVVNDILRFEAKRPYDELISNLPFGNRVGNHESCERLYRGLVERLPKLVKKGGVAVLYTMEFTLLKRLVRERKDLEILRTERTEAGGLTPMIMVLRVN